MQRFLAALGKFHHYSMGNQILIAAQNPDATYVAGFKRWLELNRYVRKGEHGIGILAPIVKKMDDDLEALLGFKVVYVFDVTQTEGDPLPAEPDWKSPARQAELEERLA